MFKRDEAIQPQPQWLQLAARQGPCLMLRELTVFQVARDITCKVR